MFEMFLHPQMLSKLTSAILEHTNLNFLYRAISKSLVLIELLMLVKIHMDVISEFTLSYITGSI